MKKSSIALLLSIGLACVSTTLWAADPAQENNRTTTNVQTTSKNMHMAAWDNTWCERHPRKCENRRRYEREEWCDRHPAKCERRHMRHERHEWCERHPGRC